MVFASSTEQVAQVVRAANQARSRIAPWGNGTRQQMGTCLAEVDTVLCLNTMNRVTELDAGNFTAQVEAGLSGNELQKQLAEHNLFFPLIPARSGNGTIGGHIATNSSGSARILYGNLRDLVLGVTVVTPTGDIVHTGGKTMKNVAGLDLCKMFTGSWGTLGVITGAVLRLYPIPEVMKGFCSTFSGYEDAFRMIGRVLDSPLTPAAIELFDAEAGRHLEVATGAKLNGDDVLLLITAEGTSGDVARHQKDITGLAGTHGAKHTAVLETEQVAQVWKAYHSIHHAMPGSHSSMLQGKASVPISRLGDMFREVKQTGAGYNVQTGITAHAGSGILYPYIAAGEDQAIGIVDELKRAAAALGGYFMVEAAPLQIRKRLDIMPLRNDYPLMKRLKTELDPHNILNPGRLVGGLY